MDAIGYMCLVLFVICLAVEAALIHSMRPKYREGCEPEEQK